MSIHKEMTREILIKKYVTNEDIDNIMSTAMKGIAYWCDEVKVKGKVKPEHDGAYTSECLSLGYTLSFHDEEDDLWHNLTLNKFLKAFSLMTNFDIDNYDSFDADMLVQLAIFGKVVYG